VEPFKGMKVLLVKQLNTKLEIKAWITLRCEYQLENMVFVVRGKLLGFFSKGVT
jgi:hypothetical protein